MIIFFSSLHFSLFFLLTAQPSLSLWELCLY
ncbi:BnaC03g74250D [Brassica napus]|uniref:BnaC03g74250D protein n=1 Tax=Brassica napus TaxID=3708 RepID=A0A078JBS6_BRANA|nr:BnaC03g74250D [Brassica napus]